MAGWCSPLPTGGYECDYVESVPKSLSCPVCLLPFRDPHLLDCCGAKYCAVCIGRVKAAGQPCPLCKQQFTTMLDKSYQRKVLNLMVRCSRKKDGCDWEGELQHLEHHEMKECGRKCCYECGVCVPRPQLVEYELHLCPKRPVHVKLESAMTKMEERHKREMDTVKKEFMREMVAVKEDLQREIKRKNQEIATMKEDSRTQQQVTEKKLAEQRKEYTSKMKVMEESLAKLTLEMRVYLSLPPCELVMTEYSKHKRDDDTWYSPPFYTGPGGYKMCLRVHGNGHKDGTSTHVSVFVNLMRGEHDDKLAWPFRGDVTIQLVNQNKDQDHVEKVVEFADENDAADSETSGRVTSGERAKHSWGYHTFISHAKLESTAGTKQYVKNGCMKFRVTKVVVRSV